MTHTHTHVIRYLLQRIPEKCKYQSDNGDEKELTVPLGTLLQRAIVINMASSLAAIATGNSTTAQAAAAAMLLLLSDKTGISRVSHDAYTTTRFTWLNLTRRLPGNFKCFANQTRL